MATNKKEKECLEGFIIDTKAQIAAFDQKASILLATVGIVFALLSLFSSILGSESFINSSDETAKTIFRILFIAVCFSAFFSMLIFVLVLFPRRKRKTKNSKTHINYYMDGAKLKPDEFKKEIESYIADNTSLVEQTIVNDKICRTKHILLEIGVFSLIPFVILTLAVVFMSVLVF